MADSRAVSEVDTVRSETMTSAKGNMPPMPRPTRSTHSAGAEPGANARPSTPDSESAPSTRTMPTWDFQRAASGGTTRLTGTPRTTVMASRKPAVVRSTSASPRIAGSQPMIV